MYFLMHISSLIIVSFFSFIWLQFRCHINLYVCYMSENSIKKPSNFYVINYTNCYCISNKFRVCPFLIVTVLGMPILCCFCFGCVNVWLWLFWCAQCWLWLFWCAQCWLWLFGCVHICDFVQQELRYGPKCDFTGLWPWKVKVNHTKIPSQ